MGNGEWGMRNGVVMACITLHISYSTGSHWKASMTTCPEVPALVIFTFLHFSH